MKLPNLFKALGLTAAIVVSSQTALLFQQSEALAGTGSNRLNNGESLKVNEFLVSSNGLYQLYLQGDGNLVAVRTSDNTTYWASQTGGTYANKLVMQGDNNLVLYRDNTPIWGASNTWGGEPGSFLQMGNDGRAVVYKPTAVWTTSSPPTPPIPPIPDPCIQQQVSTEQGVSTEQNLKPICPLY